MKKLIVAVSFAAAGLVSPPVSASGAGESVSHYKGKPAETLPQAVANFSEYNRKLKVLLDGPVTDADMDEVHQLTYTLETLIQAGYKGLRVASVPVKAHPPVRPSRLFTSTAKYVLLQGANVLRITALYKPLKIFSIAAGVFLGAGCASAAAWWDAAHPIDDVATRPAVTDTVRIGG